MSVASLTDAVWDALSRVQDPEIHKPITELGMVDAVTIDDSTVTVRLLLTVEGCPLKDTLNRDITAAVGTVTAANWAGQSRRGLTPKVS